MSMSTSIRPETTNDLKQITEVTIAAFKNHPHSNQSEHLLVTGLREQEALMVSLVAELHGNIIGHIAFSKVTINNEDQNWYGLAPVSVDPEYQNNGIGSQLINIGIEEIQKLGANGCVLLGEPEYYNRFGFFPVKGLTLEDVPPEFFLARSFDNNRPSGKVAYHPVFAES